MIEDRLAVGVDLGGTAIKVGLVSPKGKILKKEELKSHAEKGPDAVVKQIIKGINLVAEGNWEKIIGVGIGSPGSVFIKKGTVENPPNFPGWGKVPLGSMIKKKIKKDVYVENDANAAAIGELIFGAGKAFDNFVLITLGTGVGGGVIINKEIYRGENGAAGEIGHMTIDGNGPKCNCGSYGCIEAYIGNSYLIARVLKELHQYPKSKIHRLMKDDGSSLTPKLIHEAALLNDKYARSIIEDIGLKLGVVLGSVVNLLDVTNIIIGGGVSGFGELLFNAVEKRTKERVMKPLKEKIKVIPAKLKNEAGVKGASALVFYKS